MTDDPWKTGPPQPGATDESTQEIDVEAMRRARDPAAPSSDRETSRGFMGGSVGGSVHDDPTVMAPPRRPPKRGGRVRDDGMMPAERDAERARMNAMVTPNEPWSPALAKRMDRESEPPPPQTSQEPQQAVPDSVPVIISESSPENEVLLADVEDIESVEDDEELDDSEAGLGPMRRVIIQDAIRAHDERKAAEQEREQGGEDELPRSSQRDVKNDPAPSLIGTLPGHDVAQALRAMMSDVPDTYEPLYGGRGEATMTSANGEPASSASSSLLVGGGGGPPTSDRHPASSEIGEVTPNFSLPSRIDDELLPFRESRARELAEEDVDDNSHLDDGDTQTKLPEMDAAAGAPPSFLEPSAPSSAPPPQSEALPAFSLDDEDEDHNAPPRGMMGPPTRRLDFTGAPSPPHFFGGGGDSEFGAVTRRAPETGPPPSGATLARAPAPSEILDSDPAAPIIPNESTAITRAVPELTRPGKKDRTTETTAVFDAPVPSLARGTAVDRSELSASFSMVESEELETVNPSDDDDDDDAARIGPLNIGPPPPSSANPLHDILEGELPRFTMASIPEMALQGPAPEPAEPPSGWSAQKAHDHETPAEPQAAAAWAPPDGWASPPSAPPPPPEVAHTLTSDVPPAPMLEPDELLDEAEIPTSAGVMGETSSSVSSAGRPPQASQGSMDSVDVRISDPSIHQEGRSSPHIDPAFADEAEEDPTAAGIGAAVTSDTSSSPSLSRSGSNPLFQETAPPQGQPGGLLDLRGVLGRQDDDDDDYDEGQSLDESEIEEIVDDAEIVEDVQTSAGAPRPEPDGAAPLPVFRPTVVRPTQPPAFADAPDAQETDLAAEQRWEDLISLYRQRLADTDMPTRKATLLLKIASVYETGLQELNEAFMALVDAFEVQPTNEDVITQLDRVGIETGRMGELAEKVRRKLVPNSPDDKRVIFLGHLVYWYEKVLSKGKEVSPLVSDIERHDKVHPVVLKRAAQIAGMNGDLKTQREHLLRALERTYRREEKVALHLQLSSAFTGTPDALKHYQLALEIDPACIVALQGVKRLGKEKEHHAQVQWALERQVEVAPTESEKVDALLELAELQETKFLKRELAAELLEQVIAIEPSQPQALKGLERCYHALRDWPKLARILSIRSEHTFEKKTKVELLELAAEVHESKLGDPSAAVELYRNILVVEPKHRRALTDLARLYEKLGDWANVATYKARLAELAPTKRASSQEFVKLGDFLNLPERDPNAAKEQYERAVEVDATNAAAWEALQKVAAAEGDEPKVIDCLENRKKHTEVPRQKAVILVELANVYLSMNDEDAAQKCFEEAIRADSSNEVAAIAMLDSYTANEQWAEAAPLCELLVNAAIRDRDGEALFVRLRLATRIAAALGDADRAVTSAIAALDARPKDPGAQADLIAVCAQSPPALDRSREHLMRIAEDCEELSLEMIVRLAHLMRDLGDLDMSTSLFERARRESPDDKEIALQLSEAYLAQADYPRSCKIKVDLARSAPTSDERFNLLVEAGEIWARRADELEKAASLFEEARQIKPMDPWLLQTLMWLYGELGEWQILSGVLEDIVQLSEKPEDKVKTLISMAEVVRDKLNDRVRAADLYDAVLDIDKKRLKIFEELVRTLTEEKNWERLERSYRKMIARVKDDDEQELQFLLFHQLGLIYRDRLGDASRAYDALDAASRLRPEDGEIRKIVIELLVVTDNLDNAVARIRSEIDRDAHNAQLYAELYELFLRQHMFDKAWCVVNVLCRMTEPTAEQRRFHEDYAPMPLDRVPGQIVEQAWRSHIFHADLETELTNLFALMTPAVARLRFGQLRPEQRVGRPFTPAHSRMHDAIRMTFNNASEILACNAPELLLGDPKGTTAFSPALAPFGSIMVCVPQVEAQSSSLIYLCGKRLAEQRPELAARAFFPSVPDLTSLLGTAIRVSRNEVAKDAAGAALDASFAAILTPQERDGMRSIVLSATADGASLDVKKWSMTADLSSMRAGLLLCGDVEPARQSIQMDGAAASDLPAQEKIAELYKFAVSDLYSDLRGAIGVAVSDT